MGNSIAYDYLIRDRYSAPLNKIAKVTKKFTDISRKAQQQVGKLGNQFKKTGDKMANIQSAIAGAGAGFAIKALVEDSLKMADAMSDIEKVSSLSGKSLKKLRTSLEDLSEKIGRPAEGLARIAFEGKKLGTADKDLIPFIETVSKMAIAFDMSEEAAGKSIGSIKAKLGLSMDAVIALGDSLNYLADNTTANGENMIDIVSRVSGTFSILKIPPGVAAGFAAVADQLSESSELGASGLNMMFNKMLKMPGMTKKMMNDPMKAVEETMRRFSKLPADQQPTAILKAFGPEAGRFVMKLVPKMKLFGDTMSKAMDKSKVNSMNREMQNFLKRSSTQLKIANEKIGNSFRMLGDALTPIVVLFANVISKVAKFAAKMSISHPILMKIATAVLLLGAAIPLLMVPLGLLISGMGTLTTIVAAISWPITGIIVGVAALAAAFVYFNKVNHPVIAALKDVGSLLFTMGKQFFSLFEGLGIGSDLMVGVTDTFNVFGAAIYIALAPIRAFLVVTTSLFEIMKKLFKLDFSGAFSSLKGGVSKFGAIFGIGGEDPAKTAASSAAQSSVATKTQNVNVGGEIVVAAEKGSTLVSATPDLDTGINMRGA